MSNGLRNIKWRTWIILSKTVNRFEIGLTIIKESWLNTTQNEHVYAICCRLEAGCDVNSGLNAKTIECCVALLYYIKQLVACHLSVSEITNRRHTKFWSVASYTSLRYFFKRPFCDGESASVAATWTRFAVNRKQLMTSFLLRMQRPSGTMLV